MQEITHRFAHVRLHRRDMVLSNDVCTVYTTFEGGYHATLTLYMDMAMMVRFTQEFLGDETVTPQDVEEFTKEYFNVICGQLVAKVFQTTHTSARFQIPRFYTGRQIPPVHSGAQWVLNYSGDCDEGAQLLYQLSEPAAMT